MSVDLLILKLKKHILIGVLLCTFFLLLIATLLTLGIILANENTRIFWSVFSSIFSVIFAWAFCFFLIIFVIKPLMKKRFYNLNSKYIENSIEGIVEETPSIISITNLEKCLSITIKNKTETKILFLDFDLSSTSLIKGSKIKATYKQNIIVQYEVKND